MDLEQQVRDSGARKAERDRCAAFLELLADVGAYEGQATAEALRKIASHMREREKWEEIIRARTMAKKPLPWE